jgi:hypothetical protein
MRESDESNLKVLQHNRVLLRQTVGKQSARGQLSGTAPVRLGSASSGAQIVRSNRSRFAVLYTLDAKGEVRACWRTRLAKQELQDG